MVSASDSVTLFANNHVTSKGQDIKIRFMIFESLKQDVVVVSIGAAEVFNAGQ